MNIIKAPLWKEKLGTAKNRRLAVRTRKHTKAFLWAVIRAVFIIGFSFIILSPIISMLSKVFMDKLDLYDNTVLWVPRHFTLENIEFAAGTMHYGSSLLRTIVFALTTSVLQTLVTMLVGYGFARYRFRFNKLLFAVVLLTILVPPAQLVIPIYFHFKNFDIFGIIQLITGKPGLNLLDSMVPFMALSLTGMGIRNGLFIFIFRQVFRSMPLETEEAAFVDGAGHFRTFYRIMAPNAVTVALVLLFSFVWQWNDTFYSGLFLHDYGLLPQSFQLYNSYISGRDLISQMDVMAMRFNLKDPNVLGLLRNAGVFLVMFPLLFVYAVLQRFFVDGIERTGIVG